MSWPLVTLADVAPSSPIKLEEFGQNADIWQITLDHIESNTGHLLQKSIKPLSKAGSSTHVFDDRHVLYSKLRPYLNKVLLPDEIGIGTTELVPMLPDSERLDRNYLAHYLKSNNFVSWISSQTAGAKMPRVSMKVFWDHKIPLPPLKEQKRIAAILDKADALRRKRQQAIDLTDQLLRSVFLDMFGDPVTNPKGWHKKKFGEVTQSRLGKMLDAKQRTGLHQRYYLRNPNVLWGRIALDDLKRMDFDEKDQKEFQLKNGDVLICEGGAVGRAAIWRNDLDDCYFQKALHRVRPITDAVNSEFICDLMWFLDKHGGLKDYVSTATISHLTGAKLKSIDIPIPPIELQKQYANYVEKYRNSLIRLERAKSLIDELSSSITKNAFRGELTKQTEAA